MASTSRLRPGRVSANTVAQRSAGSAATGALFAALCACGTAEPPESPTGPRVNESPVALAWVGYWDGSAVSTESSEPHAVTLEIRFVADPQAACPECVSVSLDSVFEAEGFRISAATMADLSYRDGDLLRSLSLQKLSQGEAGNTIAGIARVQGPGGELVYRSEFLVVRRR